MRKIVVILMILVFAFSVQAIQFKNMGTKASSLGGAYTAIAEGISGIYYNPSGLARTINKNQDRTKKIEIDFLFGVRGENYVDQSAIDDFEDLNDLLDKTYNTAGEAAAGLTQALTIYNRIQSEINPNPLLNIEPDVGFGLRISHFGLYMTTSNVVSLKAYIDSPVVNGTDLAPGDSTYLAGLANIVAEVGVAYGRTMFNDNLDIGLTIKAIGGISRYVKKQGLNDAEDFASDDLKIDDIKFKSPQITFDLGLRYRMLEDKLAIAIVGKNLTGPDISGDGQIASSDTTLFIYEPKIEIDPMVRLGIRYKPLNWMNIAADIDLTENEVIATHPDSEIAGYKSQDFSLGIEFNIFNRRRFNIPLRIGYNTNLAESSSTGLLTGGIGVNFLFGKIELAGGMNDDFDIDKGKKFANFTVGIYW